MALTSEETRLLSDHIRKHGLRTRFSLVAVLLRLMEWVWPYKVSLNLSFTDSAS